MDKDIVKRYSFSDEERNKLQDLEIGIVSARAALDGMQIYKNAILSSVYKRLGIDGEENKEWTKRIQYNLSENVITYTRTPKKEEPKVEVKK